MCWADLKLTYDYVCDLKPTYDHVCVGPICVHVCIGSISLGEHIVLDLEPTYVLRGI